MPRKPELRLLRDEHVRKRYRQLCKKHPQWRVEAIMDLMSGEVFLTPVSIAKILKANNERVPDHSTLAKRAKSAAALQTAA